MAFLNDVEIETLIANGAIRGVSVRSANATSEKPSQVQPCSLDIRIDEIYLPLDKPENDPLRTSSHSLAVGASVRVSTKEIFELPADIGGILMAPARLTRRGILIPDLGHIDPGFDGPLRMTLINLGREADRLQEGDVVGTVLLFRLAKPADTPFNVQPGSDKHLKHGVSDVQFLSPDFLDFEKRANACARSEARKALGVSGWKVFLHWALPIFLGIGSAYVLYVFTVDNRLAKVEAQVDVARKLIDIDQRLSRLENGYASQSAGQKPKVSAPAPVSSPADAVAKKARSDGG